MSIYIYISFSLECVKSKTAADQYLCTEIDILAWILMYLARILMQSDGHYKIGKIDVTSLTGLHVFDRLGKLMVLTRL